MPRTIRKDGAGAGAGVPGLPSATCQVRNGLRAAAAHHRSHDQPVTAPTAAPVTILGTRGDRLNAFARSPPGPGPDRTDGTSGRTRPDRWNLGPVGCASRWPHGPRRPLQGPWFRGRTLPRLAVALPGCCVARGSGPPEYHMPSVNTSAGWPLRRPSGSDAIPDQAECEHRPQTYWSGCPALRCPVPGVAARAPRPVTA